MDPLTMIALGNAGMSGIQGINSGIKGAKANKQLNAAQSRADETYGNLMTQGQNVLGGVIGNAGNYATPMVGGGNMMYAGGSPGGGLAGTGGQSDKGAAQGAQQGMGLDQHILQSGMAASEGVAGNHRATADALGNQGLAGQAAGLLGGGYQNNVNMPGFVNNVGGIPQAGAQMGFNAPGMDQFNFAQPGQMANQMVSNALEAGDRARVGVREQLAGGTSQMQQGLNAALAGQGLSANSGAAAAALQGNAMQGIQQMAGLERGIADMAGNAALQGAQMDTQNLMAMTGMGAQHNMGMNQLTQQSALNAFQANLGAQGQHFGQQMAGSQLQNMIDQGQNQFGLGTAQLQAGIDQSSNQYRLGAAQGLAGLQGMQNDVTMQQGSLRNAAYTDPLGMMQGIYQQNYLNPQMQMNQILSGVGGQMMAGGLGGMEAGLDRRSKAVANAGSGKGSSMGNAQGFLTDAGKSGKGSGGGLTDASPGATGSFGVSF